jgi:hypothetical protein
MTFFLPIAPVTPTGLPPVWRGWAAFPPVSIMRGAKKERHPQMTQIAQMQWAAAKAAIKTRWAFSLSVSSVSSVDAFLPAYSPRGLALRGDHEGIEVSAPS